MKNSVAYPHLLNVGLLQGLPLETREAFVDACTLRYHADKSPLLQQGEPTKGCFLVARGRIVVSFLDHDGNMSVAHIAGPGEVLGEVEALGGTPCAASCTSLSDSTVAWCPEALLMELARHPEVIRNIARILHERLVRDNLNRSVELFQSTEMRLWLHLTQFSTPEDPEIQISQTDLATLTGCSRQKMNRMLQALRDDGIVDLRRGKIVICDRPGLMKRVAAVPREEAQPAVH